MKKYPTDLSDRQWLLFDSILNDNRKRKHSLRDMLNAIFYLLKTGCQWRILPCRFPKWELVYYYFSKWKNESPSLARIGGDCRGIGGGKKIKGRKRHIIVDTMGLLLAVIVHAANEHDSKGSKSNTSEAMIKLAMIKLIKVVHFSSFKILLSVFKV